MDTGLNTSKLVGHKAGKFIGNKVSDTITKSSNDNNEQQKTVEEIFIPPEKRKETLNKFRKVLKNGIKYLNY